MSFPCTVNYVLPYAMEFSKQRSFAVLLTIIQEMRSCIKGFSSL
ncbi:hypothetical protein HanXRQr2_Chr06g0240011 [Helianthus annuus]|uniref:Uncharacterized protein n=1 Tax=Helianthus annuus TaxID=4232 RepID=A0A9K3IQK3_HELAN|nr:hypothetical protein HanXRQr2_Chr06g0240011 [Helianthus annuus]KAJ0572062.1 hypothetical protein HanHA89_Chr06g0211671 [Helianthus annuus]